MSQPTSAPLGDGLPPKPPARVVERACESGRAVARQTTTTLESATQKRRLEKEGERVRVLIVSQDCVDSRRHNVRIMSLLRTTVDGLIEEESLLEDIGEEMLIDIASAEHPEGKRACLDSATRDVFAEFVLPWISAHCELERKGLVGQV